MCPIVYLRSSKAVGSFAAGVLTLGVTFCLCYAALKVTAKAVRKRQDILNAEPDDTMDKE